MANQYRKSTLKFTFRNEFARPKALEVERFLREEVKIPAADVLGIHFSIVSSIVYVKIINDATCERILRETKQGLRFCHADGNVGTVDVDHAGLGLRTIRIFELPFELPAEDVEAALRPYGTVHNHLMEKWTQFQTYPVLNGVRQVRIDLKRHVPSYLHIGGCRAIIIYDGQPRTCSGCGKEGHLRSECMQRRITQLPPADVMPPSQPTLLPVTYVAALTTAAASPRHPTPSDDPLRLSPTERGDGMPVLRVDDATPTALPPSADDVVPDDGMAVDSLIVPTAAFVPERRESLPSSDTEGHTRKQRSPKRRKRRRRAHPEQAEEQPLEDEESTQPDDAPTEVAAAGSSMETRNGTDVPADERSDIDMRDGCCPPHAGVQAPTLCPGEAMEDDLAQRPMQWGEEVDEGPAPVAPAL